MVSKVRAFTYFFGHEHLKESSDTEIEISKDLCQQMIDPGRSPAGPLTASSHGLLQTNNRLNWEWPSWGLPSCCRWHE